MQHLHSPSLCHPLFRELSHTEKNKTTVGLGCNCFVLLDILFSTVDSKETFVWHFTLNCVALYIITVSVMDLRACSLCGNYIATAWLGHMINQISENFEQNHAIYYMYLGNAI